MKKKMQIGGGLLLVGAFVVFLWPRQRTEPVAVPTAMQTAQTAPVEQMPKAPQPSAVRLVHHDTVAPETEAALAQFGLSATSVVKLAVVAQARTPVIFPNHLNHKTQ